MFEQLRFLAMSHDSGVETNSRGWRELGVVFDVA